MLLTQLRFNSLKCFILKTLKLSYCSYYTHLNKKYQYFSDISPVTNKLLIIGFKNPFDTLHLRWGSTVLLLIFQIAQIKEGGRRIVRAGWHSS
jgi:hypothetical protein